MGHVVGIIVGLVWLALFIHWLGRAEFYPIAGKGWRTKIFWGIALLTLNPLLILLYFIFGVRLHSVDYSPRRLKTARIVVFTIFAFSLPLSLPIGRLPNKPRILTKATKHKANDLSARVSALQSSNSFSGGGGMGFESITYLDLHHIAILNKSDHPLAIKTAQRLQQWLLEAPMVDEVAYYPKGTYPTGDSRLPGLYIELGADDVWSMPLPLARNTRAKVDFRIETLKSFTSPWQPLPISHQDTFMTIMHQSTTFGYESYAAKYDTVAQDIINALFTHMKSFMGKTWYSSAPIPLVPEYCLGTYSPTPDMPFDANKSLGKISGYELLTHNHTTWWFEESRPSEEALAAYRDALLESGWENHSRNATNLQMERGNETLDVQRSDNTPGKGQVVPMIAHYTNPFTREETDHVLDQLIKDDTLPADTLLFFGRQFRESGSESLIAHFRERMGSDEPDSLQGHLELSRFWGEQGEKEKARKELLRAVAGSCLHYDGSARFPIERQAELLGDPTLVNTIPADQDLRVLGLIPMDSITTNITFNVTPEKPFGLYAFGSVYDAGVYKEKVRTYALRVVHDPFKITPIYSWKSLPNRHWSLVLAGNNTADGTFSWSFQDGNINNGLWCAGMNLQMPGSADTRIRIDVHQIDDETFECSLRPLVGPVSHITIL